MRKRNCIKQSNATITITKVLASTVHNVYTSTTKTLLSPNSSRSTKKVDLLKTQAFLLEALITFPKHSHNQRITTKLRSVFTSILMVFVIMGMNVTSYMKKFQNQMGFQVPTRITWHSMRNLSHLNSLRSSKTLLISLTPNCYYPIQKNLMKLSLISQEQTAYPDLKISIDFRYLYK